MGHCVRLPRQNLAVDPASPRRCAPARYAGPLVKVSRRSQRSLAKTSLDGRDEKPCIRIDGSGRHHYSVGAWAPYLQRQHIVYTARRASDGAVGGNPSPGPHIAPSKGRSRRQKLNSRHRPDHHVSGWRASKQPHKLAAPGSSPRSDPGSTVA